MLKKDFPIFENNPWLVYLDSAATLQKPKCVIDGVATYMQKDYANIHRGRYSLSERSEHIYWQARRKTAELLWGQDDEIIFTASSTDSVNKLIKSLMFTWLLSHWDTVLLTKLEHHANIVPWQIVAKEYWIILDFVELDAEQKIDMKDLQQKLHDKVKVFSCTMVSNVTGGVSDMKAIKDILDQASSSPLRFVDASQSVPHMPVDVHALWADALYFTGHKLWAITGIGVLRWKNEFLKSLEPARWGGGMVEEVRMDWYSLQWVPDKFEPWTPNLVGAVSLLYAIQYIESLWNGSIEKWFEKIHSIEKPLMEYCMEKFAELEKDGILLVWPKHIDQKIWVFAFQLPPWKNATQLWQYMAKHDMCIRCGAQCAHIFHAWLADMTAWKSCIQHTCRISLWWYNDIQDIVKFFAILEKFLYN